MQKSIEDIRNLLSKTDPRNVGEIVRFLESKLEWLKICYKNSDDHFKRGILDLINYEQLKCYLTEKPYSNSDKTKKIDLDDIVYDAKSIKNHIKRLPDTKQSIDIYNFYFGGYADLFNVFTIGFLTKTFKKDNETFLNDILSARRTNDQEKLHIAGVTIIDSNFLNQVRNKQGITKSQFFAGLQSNHTQFYGVLNQFDIERRDFQDFKNVVRSYFKGVTDHKIIALVTGHGGSGKSTFLRRLAVELCLDKNFKPTVLWLDSKSSIAEFMSSCIESIKKYTAIQFLLIIEDWYRITDSIDHSLINDLLKNLDSLSNIRVIIGDRNATGKPYLKHLSGTKHDALYLDNDENERIISEIIKDFPDWENAVEILLEDKKGYQTTLFLLLFIIAHYTIEENQNTPFYPKDLQRTFINIVESDLKVIRNSFPGVAFALYYWGCVYANKKFFISYKTFLEVADQYNGSDGKILRHFEELDINDPIHEKLRIYIRKDSNGYLLFNHDTLADFGLSKIDVEGIPPFTDILKREVLDIIIERGDDYSASVFLTEMIRVQPPLLLRNEGLGKIDLLLSRGNKYMYYMNQLANMELSIEELKLYAKQFTGIEYYELFAFWKYYFTFFQEDEEILNHILTILQTPQKYPSGIVCEIICLCREQSFGQNFIKRIFQSNEWVDLDSSIIIICFESWVDDVIKRSFCNKTLRNNYWIKFPPTLLINMLLEADRDIAEKFSNEILRSDDWKSLDYNLLFSCLECADIKICQQFSNKVLSYENWEDLDIQLVIDSLPLASNAKAQKFSSIVLYHEDWKKFDKRLIYNSLKNVKSSVAQKFCDNVLRDFEYSKSLVPLYFDPICRNASNEAIQDFYNHFFSDSDWAMFQDKSLFSYLLGKKRFYALALSNNYKTESWPLIYQALFILSNEPILPDIFIHHVHAVISHYHSGIEPDAWSYFFSHLLSFDLSRIPEWQIEFQTIINDWVKYERWMVTAILRQFHEYPEKAEDICKLILNSWKVEINKPCSPELSEIITIYGEHVKIALGHPNLRSTSEKIAIEIYSEIKSDKIKISPHIRETIFQIVENGIYPKWDENGFISTVRELSMVFELENPFNETST